MLFFDLTSLGNDDLVRAHDAAAKFVKQQMTKADLVSVVVFSSNLRVLSDFTNDHDKLNKAIAQLLPGVSSQLANPLYTPPRKMANTTCSRTPAPPTPPTKPNSTFSIPTRSSKPSKASPTCSARFPAEKSVIEFTGGITQTGEENRTQLRAATDAANRANVSIYSIDSRGLIGDRSRAAT